VDVGVHWALEGHAACVDVAERCHDPTRVRCAPGSSDAAMGNLGAPNIMHL
jgi:hypothetical protein